MENEKKMYEIGYLLTPLIPEEKVDEEVAVLRKTIEDKQGLVLSEGKPKSKKLAYSIKTASSPSKGFEVASFGWIKFMSGPEAILEIKSSFDSNSNLIRFIIIKTVENTGPQKRVKPMGVGKKKENISSKEEERVEIKPEEIDKKLEELIGEDVANQE